MRFLRAKTESNANFLHCKTKIDIFERAQSTADRIQLKKE